MHEMEHFFVSYHRERGQEFRILKQLGPSAGWKVLEKAKALYTRKRAHSGNGKRRR